MADIWKKDNEDDIEKPEEKKSGSIAGGSVIVTEERITKNVISGGSAVVVNNRVDVNKIAGGAVVICFGPVKVTGSITGGASVISRTRIDAGSVERAANLAAAPQVNVKHSNSEDKIMNVPQAFQNKRVKQALKERFGVNLNHSNVSSLPELMDL